MAFGYLTQEQIDKVFGVTRFTYEIPPTKWQRFKAWLKGETAQSETRTCFFMDVGEILF